MTISGTFDGTVTKMADAKVEVDIGLTSSYVAIETWANAVDPQRGAVGSSETKTLDGTTHVSTDSTPGSARVTVTCVFSKGATDPFLQIYGTDLGSDFGVRWSKSGTAGDVQFTAEGYLAAVSPPSSDGNNSGVQTFTFEVVASDIAAAAISS